MNLTINGKKEDVMQIVHLADLLRYLKIGEDEKGFAVAVNEEVVFRSMWQTALVKEGDTVEIIRATQGG